MIRKAFTSESTPPPAGTYSVAMQAGPLVFLSGQTPRDRDNVRHGDKPFAEQAKMALDNLEAAANAASSSLRDAVKVGVFLKDMANAQAFDAIYATYVGSPPPARTLTQSGFSAFDIEVDAILAMGAAR
ncbi:RidA family protein [Variovorax sp. UMC13]|uniref:RidA family protein n=1 Tax=Variovorax sp. UMC13 TaxID=1862326 RepID=UPI0015FF8C18|nr:RidA family protein [Variovorax sp. UMC13]MBB1600493.1 enamine deaminase RidA [Variovorax sp. UMC13]